MVRKLLRLMSVGSSILSTLLLGLMVSQSAGAANLLFEVYQYTEKVYTPHPRAGCKGFTPGPYGTGWGGACIPWTGIVNTTGNGGFTLPDRLMSAVTSFTMAMPQYGYPYFKGTGNPYVATIVMGPGGGQLTATQTFTFNDPAYPYVTATTIPGYIRIKPGPNAFGGALPVVGNTFYQGLQAAPGGGNYSFQWQLGIDGRVTQDGVFQAPVGWSVGTHTTLMTPSGGPVQHAMVAKALSFLAHTGTATISKPPPVVGMYTMTTGMDNRNLANGTGTIQVVMPGIGLMFHEESIPPPLDGSGTITGFRESFAGFRNLSMTFLPEPGQVALFGAGIVGLGFLARRKLS